LTRSNSAVKPNFGVQTPRIEWVPPGSPHPDQEAALEFAEAADFTLQDWQNHVFSSSLLEKRPGKWASFENGLVVPRQNGKTELAVARMLAGALVLDERLIIYTAHLAKTSEEAFRRIREKIAEVDWIGREVKHVWRSNGREVIEFRNGARILCQTRTPSSGRGFAKADCVFLDEAMYLPASSIASILFILGRAKNPQLWYMGSAPNQLTQPDSVALAAIRLRALEQNDPSLFYAEWSMPYDHPDAVPVGVLTDPEYLAGANPAYGMGLSHETCENEYRAARADIKSFIIERGGVGDWPAVDAEDTVIDLDRWAELADPDGAIQGAGVFALDVSPDRAWASIGVAGKRADGSYQVEVAEHKRGTAWVVPWLEQRRAKVVFDGRGPAGSMEPALVAAGIEVEPVTTGEHCRACGIFYDAVAEGTVRHLNDTLLSAALAAAQRRQVGDSWLWSRAATGADISPLVAVTLALAAAVGETPKSFVAVAFA
jgi:hypothetical protein